MTDRAFSFCVAAERGGAPVASGEVTVTDCTADLPELGEHVLPMLLHEFAEKTCAALGWKVPLIAVRWPGADDAMLKRIKGQ